MGEAKEVLLLEMSGDHGRENAILILFHLFYFYFLRPNVSIVTRKEGEKVTHEENSQNCHLWTYI
jgi:hypothetical protein